MIKNITTVSLTFVFLLIFTGCLGEGETIKEVDPVTGKVTEKSEAQVIGEVLEENKWFEKNVIYSGTGTVTYVIDEGEECKSLGPTTVTLKPDGQSIVIHVGNCMKYGSNGCTTDGDKCENTVNGTYTRNMLVGEAKIFPSGCNNGSFTTNGESTFNNDTSSGLISCIDNGQIQMFVQWDSLPKIQ